MKSLPSEVTVYRSTPRFTAATIPAGLQRAHRTRPGTWGRIVVESGALRYRILEPVPEEHVLGPDRPGIVEPGIEHEVAAVGAVTFFVEFLSAPPTDAPCG